MTAKRARAGTRWCGALLDTPNVAGPQGTTGQLGGAAARLTIRAANLRADRRLGAGVTDRAPYKRCRAIAQGHNSASASRKGP